MLAHGMPRPKTEAPHGGFWTVATIPARHRAGAAQLEVRASFAEGPSESALLAQVEVEDRQPSAEPPRVAEADRPRVAICMATFDPDPEHFRRQVDSLRAQTESDWLCLISDDFSRPERFDAIRAEIGADERFVLSRSPERIGFYRNFERALEMVPPGIDLVALCDQDDYWYPEKLETLLRGIGDAGLIFSDMRLVDDAGNVLAESLWENRPNNRDNLTSLMITNTFTGAACLFRRRVIDLALPFPHAPGWQFHDHWLGIVALAGGDVAYVDRPLYDYVQHGHAILRGLIGGRDDGDARESRGRIFSRERLRHAVVTRRIRYFHGYIPLRIYAQTILARRAAELSDGKRRALERLIAADGSALSLALLTGRRVRRLWGRGETLGAEGVIVSGILWRGLMTACTKSPRQPVSVCDATMPHFDPDALEPRRKRRHEKRQRMSR
jgi:glycosyltransferase involved in cell wall biosynthesis